MTRALRVEWLRLRQRRAAVLLTGLALIGCLIVLGLAIGNAAPPSPAAQAAAQAQVDQQLTDPKFVQQLADCRQAVAAGGSEQWPAGMDCDQALTPNMEWFLNWSAPDFVHDFRSQLLAVTTILALAMTLVGVTFAGADWAAGTIGTQLLFQPRRTLVFTSKAAAVVLAAAVIGLIGAVLAFTSSYWAAARWGTTTLVENVGYNAAGPTVLTQAALVGRAARATAAVAAAGLGGYALAMLFRSSLVAVSIIAGYGLVVETLARGLFPGAEQFLLSSRLLAWLEGPYEIVRYPPSCNLGPCDPEITTISVAAGGTYLAILVGLVLALAASAFARRDVT